MMKLWLLPLAWCCLANPASGADNCEALRSQIEAKISASGVLHFAVTTVDADAPVPGKVVGSCDLGTKKIVYDQPRTAPDGVGSPSLPARSGSAAILTECKDGTVSVGGDCKK